MFKKIFCVILSIVIFAGVFSVSAAGFTPTDFEIRAESALLVSLDNNSILYTKKADEKRYPASLTKIMTALLLIENTKDLNKEKITVSKNAVDSLLGTGSSLGGLKEGEVVTAKQMLYILLMSSANEGAMAIAEHYGQTVDNFVKMMNERAKTLGMKNTHYANPHGLFDEDHYTTVNDMYKLVKEALGHDIFKKVVSSKQYDMPKTNKNPARRLVTTNFLMLAYYPEYYYKYASGVKTGFTDEAGRCLISTATKDGYSYLCILMKSTAYDKNHNYVRYEFEDSRKLYEWAFNDFEYKALVTKDQIVGEATVNLSFDTDYVSYVPSKDFSAIIPKNADSSTIQFKVNLSKKSFDAPIKAGQKLGTADIMFANEKMGQVDIVASQNVDRSFILYIWNIIKNIFSSKAMKIFAALVVLALLLFIGSCIYLNRKRNKKRIKKYKKMRSKDYYDK